VLSSEEFTARYGDPKLWLRALWWPSHHDGSLRYAADVWDLAREASLFYRLNVDLAVQPPEEAYQHQDKPRLRLDDIDSILPLEPQETSWNRS
jgi:hypothetical protein